jgi:DNA-binding transcriptional regulator YhcF (GntR family)
LIPFRLKFEPGVAIWEQVVYAARRAMVSGQMRPGDPFPSVRVLSAELKINPNTAHKVVSALLAEGLIEVHVGVGTVVAQLPAASAAERTRLLKSEVEQLVVGAKRLGLHLDEVQSAVARHWDRLRDREQETAEVTKRRS